MGMQTILYGYIEEIHFSQELLRKKARKQDASVIRSLPIADTWPPVSKEMFSICTNYKNSHGPNLEYRGRIIHFGTSLKSVEQEWIEWKLKFESLLSRLYFLEAKVHVLPETMPAFTAIWHVDLLKYEVNYEGIMPVPLTSDHIVYEGSPLDGAYGDGK